MSESKDRQQTDHIKKDNRTYSIVVAGFGAVLLIGSAVWYLQNGRPEGAWIFAMLSIIGFISILAFIYAGWLIKQETQQEPDYYTLFVMGLIWVPLGLTLDMLPLFAVGAMFVLIGYHNKYRWKRKEYTKPQQKKRAKIAIGLGLLFLICGLTLFLLSWVR